MDARRAADQEGRRVLPARVVVPALLRAAARGERRRGNGGAEAAAPGRREPRHGVGVQRVGVGQEREERERQRRGLGPRVRRRHGAVPGAGAGNGLSSRADEAPSFARRTLLWIRGHL